MKRLIFGDLKSIAIKDNFIINQAVKNLKDKIRCPFCRNKATGTFDKNIEKKRIGWDFGCDGDCPNSWNYSEKYGEQDARYYTDLEGKFL